MAVALFIGFLALVSATLIVGFAVSKHQKETGEIPTWAEIKRAFTSGAIKNMRQDSAMISEPNELVRDLSIGDLLSEAEEGSGYVIPRDIRSLRNLRN